MSLSKILSSLRAQSRPGSAEPTIVFHEGYVAHQTLSANVLGRDFLVGDLHGSYALLVAQLHAVQFDPARDRLILTGDLIDRGAQSFECLMLLLQPWVFAVLGNHEWMLLTWLALRDSDYHHPLDYLPNGGEWIFSLTLEQQEQLKGPLIEKLLTLPFVLTVDDAVCSYHVAHGELLGKGKSVASLHDQLKGHGKIAAPLTDAELTEANVRRLATHITWSRRLVREANEGRRSMACRGLTVEVEGIALSPSPIEPGLALTYVGHNIVPRAVMHRSHVYLDRGAYENSVDSELFMVEHGRFARELRNLGVL